jgi:hypothetical protein
MKKLITQILCILLATTLTITSCEGPDGKIGPQGDQGDKGDKGDKGDQGDPAPGPPTEVDLKAHSITPSLVSRLSGFENIEVMPLISSEDQLIETPNFIFGGSADGAGLLKTASGYSLLVNHEDNFSVSRISFDKSFKPVAGEYLLNSSGGIWRLCSATLATPEEHGFGPVYLTCGESSVESQTHALNPFASSSGAGFSKAISAFGRWNAENAVPLPKTAYADRTVILIGDDDSGPNGGQLAMYITDAEKVGDLTGETGNPSTPTASVYALRRVDLNTREMDIAEGQELEVEFALIANAKDIKVLSGAQINSKATEVSSIAFGRVEDIDYRKGAGANSREVYFNVTGQDGNLDRSKRGRTYKLVLNETDPLKGKLTLVLDGDNDGGKASEFQNPDNIMVTENFAYIQEDPNTYGDETHDSYVYQYNLTSGELRKVFELDHGRSNPDLKAKFLSNDTKGNWEYGALIDISTTVGVENTFLLNVQPHTWQSDYFRNPDGGSIRPNEKQGSQVLIIKGLPK